MNESLETASARHETVPDRRPPFGSWPRTYGFVVLFFAAEVLFFAWLTWAVS